MEDVWVLRIREVGKVILLILACVPGIISAWQSVNNNTEIKNTRAEMSQKFDQTQKIVYGVK
jgi:hypothetical protein